MAIIVVGGGGKGVGKTALVCGLIAALPEFRWTAVKITSHEYGKPNSIWEETEPGQGTDTNRYPAAGTPGAPSLRLVSGARVGDHKARPSSIQEHLIWEETKPGQGTDTARYLAAGAHRALLVTSHQDSIPFDDLWKIVGPGASLIFESNTIAAHLKPDLCLGVLGPGGPDTPVKPSFQPFMSRIDAMVVLDAEPPVPAEADPATRVFRLPRLDHISADMVSWLRMRLRN